MANHERAGVKQERAGRTRALLVQAAGEEFAERGYAGTSLTRISRAAMATIGALTFHFPAKNELAEAVCERGCALTREAVGRAAGAARSPAEAVTEITGTLAALLEEQPVVRAAARLSRELRMRHDWREAWIPAVRTALTEAQRTGQLRAQEPELVGVLVACVVADLEVTAQRAYASPSCGAWSVRGRLAEVWEVLWSGIAGRRGPHPAGPPPPASAPVPGRAPGTPVRPGDGPPMA
ncbi:TetR family transcriptional regulator [Streptomyces sp. NPDC090022]|uniref:TetR family transcriptional regulator n=1 Tax=Streptomyces sp. NPDC090022 TaxID=3365920 RepID=UPI0038081DFF